MPILFSFRKVCILLVFMHVTKMLSAQSDADKLNDSKYFQFVIECPMYKCDINGKVIDSTLLIAPPNAKFILVEQHNTYCIIRFTLLPTNKKIKTSFYSTDDFTTYTYFLITKAQLDFKADKIQQADIQLLVGNIFTPIKLRFKPFDFSKDISVGTTFGLKYAFHEKQNTAVDALMGIGISSIIIDSFSVQHPIAGASDLLSFTLSYGIVLEFGNAQIGIFSGLDFISNANQQQYDWIYKNKPWISFGIGYSLFSFNVKK